jgi:hypothetical protein
VKAARSGFAHYAWYAYIRRSRPQSAAFGSWPIHWQFIPDSLPSVMIVALNGPRIGQEKKQRQDKETGEE